MATVFTHAFVGAALAGAGPQAVSKPRLAFALALLAVLPDVDVVSFVLGIPYAHPLGHRGLSHSLVVAAVAAPVVAYGVFPSVRPPSAAWWRLSLLLAAAGVSHGVLDAMTNGGLGVGFLLPFDSSRFFLPWRPLEVSPIGLRAFVTGPAQRVLESELIYVWLPVAGMLVLSFGLRRRRGAT